MESAPVIFERLPEFSRIGSFSFLFWAIAIGLFLSVVVNMGPSFITLLQTSLSRGFKSAAWFVSGVILCDAFVVSVCIMTSVQVVMRGGIEAALACVGTGVILLLFGIFTFRRKAGTSELREKITASYNEEMQSLPVDRPSRLVFLGKGFALNILNPFVWLFWFSAVAIVSGNMAGNKVSTVVFFGIILGTTYAMEMLKAWGAAKLQRFLTIHRTALINKAAGVLLMLCGAYFIIFRGIVPLV